jgi:GNAT superfamily N-acetyltransferase
MNLHIRPLEARDIQPIADAFAALGWDKPAPQYERYLAEQTAGERPVLVAFLDGVFAGYVTVKWRSHYPAFADANVPEIADFNVLPQFRRRGIGSRLMDEAERLIAERSPVAGIGVGMIADYGAAQRLYVLRGYVPDGAGVTYFDKPVNYLDPIAADHDLVLYFTKTLHT